MCPILVAHYEAKSVWKDIANRPPDLVLSIGAGSNIGDRSKAGLNSPTSVHTSTNDSASTGGSPSAVIRQGRGGMGNYKRQHPPEPAAPDFLAHKGSVRNYIVRNPQAPMLVTFNNPISGQTDRLNDQRINEKTWNNFLSTHISRKPFIRQRYRRVCPELFSKLPRTDDVAKIGDVEREAQEVLRQDLSELVEIAHRLVASTFFFEKDMASVKQKASGFTCTGTFSFYSFVCEVKPLSSYLRVAFYNMPLSNFSGSIFCKFRPYSAEIKALAWFLISLLDGDFEPYFLLEEEYEDTTLVSFPDNYATQTVQRRGGIRATDMK